MRSTESSISARGSNAWRFEPYLMLAADVSWAAAEACIQTHGGFGFAEEYDIERKFRETRLYQVAPMSTNLILSYIAEHVRGLPRSY
jgi:alkylation response protein AidB-like acyl-CoA dehydrogenase